MDISSEDALKAHSLSYPVAIGAPKFELVNVTQQKDIMLNSAILHAEQEYSRIMELVAVLQKQADGIKRRLDLTQQVHAAYFQFKVYPGKVYWLVYDTRHNRTILSHTGPYGWSTGIPDNYQYMTAVRSLGDNTWMEVQDENTKTTDI
jgi:hypothetical protein